MCQTQLSTGKGQRNIDEDSMLKLQPIRFFEADIPVILTNFVDNVCAGKLFTMKRIDNQYVNYRVHIQRFY